VILLDVLELRLWEGTKNAVCLDDEKIMWEGGTCRKQQVLKFSVIARDALNGSPHGIIDRLRPRALTRLLTDLFRLFRHLLAEKAKHLTHAGLAVSLE
jgi:hypothetical protein